MSLEETKKSSCSRAKLNRKLKSYWYKKDFENWLKVLVRMGRLPITNRVIENVYADHTTGEQETADQVDTAIFLGYSTLWNNREDVKHFVKPGRGNAFWSPYCIQYRVKCSSPRMNRVSDGWTCPECHNRIGKHLHRIK